MFQRMVGGRIKSISRICDLISIQVDTSDERSVFIHAQSLFRVLKKNNLILCSDDVYRGSTFCDEEAFEWANSMNSMFDQKLKELQSDFYNASILSVSKNETNDLLIFLENLFELQIIVNTTEHIEKYRIFNDEEEVVVV